MIEKLAECITNRCIKDNLIQDKNKEVIIYSYCQLISTVISILGIVILAIVSKQWAYLLTFSLVFIPLRRFVGGFHANKYIYCSLLTLIIYLLFLVCAMIVNEDMYIVLTIINLVISLAIKLKIGIVTHVNKPISEDTYMLMEIKSGVYTTLYFLGALTFLFAGKGNIAYAISLAMIIVFGSSMFGEIIDHLKDHSSDPT